MLDAPRTRALLAVTLLAAYALPLLVPPAAVPLLALPADAPLWSRLFPGVPFWWVLGRMVCLLAGAVLAASCVTPGAVFSPPAGPPAAADSVSLVRFWMAAVAAGLLALFGVAAAGFTRGPQLAYFAGLAVPVLVLWVGRRRAGGAAAAARESRGLVTVAPVVLVWVALQIATVGHAPRAADSADTWLGFTLLERAAAADFNLLTAGFFPGVTALHMIPQGAGVFGWALPLRFEWLQAVHVAWIAITAFGIGWLAAKLTGPTTAPVAAAAFLFSPMVLMMPLNPSAYFIGPLFTVAVLVPLCIVLRNRSMTALAALGATVGIASAHPWTLPLAGIASAALAWVFLRGRRPRPVALAIPILLLLSAALPGVPRLLRASSGVSEWYAGALWHWPMLEATLQGQVSPLTAEIGNEVNRVGWLDIQLGALLAPFAIPRTAIRLSADAPFDPIGAALAAVGIAICVRGARAAAPARGLLALLVIAVLPAFFVSTYDRPSLGRLAVTPVPMALLSAAGFAALRRGLQGRADARGGAALVAAAIVVAGTVQFYLVNPRILSGSWLRLALEVVQHEGVERTTILEPRAARRAFTWMYTVPIATQVLASPATILPYEGPQSLAGLTADTPSLLLWSPAHEEYAKVSGDVCRRWPQAALFTIRDPANASSLLVADVVGTSWQPAVPPARWRRESCAAFVQANAAQQHAARARVEAALASVAQLPTEARAEAVAVLRAAALRDTAAGLCDALARRLLQDGSVGDHQEALRWAERAAELTDYRDPRVLLLLADAAAASGYEVQAQRAARQAKELTVNGADEGLAAAIDAAVERYQDERPSQAVQP